MKSGAEHMEDKIFFSSKDIQECRIACSYFDYGMSFSHPVQLVSFEVSVSKEMFLDRCSQRIDRFIMDSAIDWQKDDESCQVLVNLKNLGFPSVALLLKSEESVLIELITYFYVAEVASELMPPTQSKPKLFVHRVHKYWFDHGQIKISGAGYKP